MAAPVTAAGRRLPTAARFENFKLVSQQDIVADGTSAVRGCEGASEIAVLMKFGTITGTSPTLDVKIQTSYDDGTSWFDLAASAQIVGTDDDKEFVVRTVARDADGGQDVASEVVDGTLAAGTAKTLPLGDRFRLKWDIGGTGTPTFPVEIWAILRRD